MNLMTKEQAEKTTCPVMDTILNYGPRHCRADACQWWVTVNKDTGTGRCAKVVEAINLDDIGRELINIQNMLVNRG